MRQQNDEEMEMNCYLRIIDFFEKEKNNRESVEIWKSNSFKKLMDTLDRTKNKKLVTNALILILTLFENFPPDIFNNRGINVNYLSQKDRDNFVSELQREFLVN